MSQFTEKEIVKVASMYYYEGMTQAAIAREMDVSRSLISKILVDARKSGVVEIYIRSNTTYLAQLERKLENKYKMKAAIVVDSYGLEALELQNRTAQAAANHMLGLVSRGVTDIGISWGSSLRKMIDYFPFTKLSQIEIFPLIGGIGDGFMEIHANQLAADLANKTQGRVKYLYAPAFVSNLQTKNELLKNKVISKVIEEAKNVDLALVGIATPYINNTMKKVGYISDEDIVILKKLKVIGETNSCFYNIDGKEVKHDINQQVIGIDLNDLKKIPNVMTIVYNKEKTQALRIALENSIVNTVALTDEIAELLLNVDIIDESMETVS